jgi:2-polyprenyl-3-methyl-5-hydroxy-6-metoxy-1,4-benzoquinol methylase
MVCGTSASQPVAEGTDYDYGTTRQPFRFVKCSHCGHLYLDPRPVITAAPQIYPSDYYTLAGEHRRGMLAVIKDRVVARRLRPVLALLPGRGGRVLEIGCGDGSLLLALKRARPELELTGVDIAFPAALRRRLEEDGVRLVEGPAESAALGGPHDLVIMNQLIEHLWDVDGVLGALHRAMRPGAVLSIATPDPSGWDRAFFARGAWGGYYFPRHLNLFSPAGLETVLGRAGFRVTAQARLVAPLVWIGSLRAVLVRRGSRLARLARDTNLALVALFTAMDVAALALGLRTSNQQVVARAEGPEAPR